MRILFITNQMPPLVDGVGDYTYNLAREFARHGHEVAVVCRADARIRTDYEDIKVFPVVKRWTFGAARPIVRLVRELGAEVVSLQYVPHGFHPKGLPFPLIHVMREVRRTGVRVQVFCHEVYVPFQGGMKNRVISFLTSRVTQGILKYCDVVTTSIDYYKQMILGLHPRNRNVGVIPIASNVPECPLSENERILLRRKIADDNETIVAFFGKRDMGTSMRALRNLIQKGYAIKALFIGNVTEKTNDVSLPCYKTGVLDLKEISPYFQVADILVLPENGKSGCSFKSGSLIAGMRGGLPVVSVCGLLTSSSLEHGKNIIFADFENVAQLERVLKPLVEDSDMRRRIGENARMLVQNISWADTCAQYEFLLNS